MSVRQFFSNAAGRFTSLHGIPQGSRVGALCASDVCAGATVTAFAAFNAAAMGNADYVTSTIAYGAVGTFIGSGAGWIATHGLMLLASRGQAWPIAKAVIDTRGPFRPPFHAHLLRQQVARVQGLLRVSTLGVAGGSVLTYADHLAFLTMQMTLGMRPEPLVTAALAGPTALIMRMGGTWLRCNRVLDGRYGFANRPS